LIEPYNLRDNTSGLYGLIVKKCSFKRKPSDIVIYEGKRGSWHPFVEAKDGYYGCGLWAKYHEDSKDSFGIHSLEVTYCKQDDWDKFVYFGELGIHTDFQSKWDSAKCPKGYFLVGGSVKDEVPQGPGVDDHSIIGVVIVCRDPKTRDTTRLVVSDRFPYLKTLAWTPDKVSPDYYVCGLTAMFDSTRYGGDATAINGIGFKLCDLTLT
jgi:hypothetical protein